MIKTKKICYIDWTLKLKLLSPRSKDSNHNTKVQVSRASYIPSELVGSDVLIHNGLRYVSLNITEQMIGYRFGQFVNTTSWGMSHKRVQNKRTTGQRKKVS